MRRRVLAVLLCLGLILAVPGCAPTPAICFVSELVQPTLISPPFWGDVSSLTPTLTWEYPTNLYSYSYPLPYYYGGPSGCVPEKYRVTLRTGPFFTDDLGGYTVDGATMSWTPTAALQPATEYAWGVAAMSAGSYGPFKGYSYFFTGPHCATADLVAPLLLEPANGATINEDWPSLIWDYPNACLPEGYRIDLSVTADFSDTSLSGGTGNPSTRWGAGHALDNCQTYYWKVAPINDTTLGPASEVNSFTIDVSGMCGLSAGPFTEWPVFELVKNAACREGPTLDHNILAYLNLGENRPAEARNDDGSWVMLRMSESLRCWVSMGTGKLSDDVQKLPRGEWPAAYVPGPTDTPVPFVCSVLDEKTCQTSGYVNYCQWVRNSQPPAYGSCVNR